MLKIDPLIICTIFINGFLTLNILCSDKQQSKDIIIYLQSNNINQTIDSMFDNNDKYAVSKIDLSNYDKKKLSKDLPEIIKEDIKKNLSQLNNSKAFLFIPADFASYGLHLAVELSLHINGLILIDPTYDSNNPLSAISGKLPKDMPIVIGYTDDDTKSSTFMSAEQIYDWLTKEKQRCIQYKKQAGSTSMTYFTKILNKNNAIPNDFYENLTTSLHTSCTTIENMANLFWSSCQPTRSYKSKSATENILQAEKDSIQAEKDSKWQEKKQYILKCGSIIVIGSSLLLFLFYKIGLFTFKK